MLVDEPTQRTGLLGDYLVVVQAPCRRLGPHAFATESAFGEHLRVLRSKLPEGIGTLRVAAPSLSQESYAAKQTHLAHIDELAEGIKLLPMHPVGIAARRFWRKEARRIFRTLRAAARQSAVVHAGIADDFGRPIMLLADLAGWLEGRHVLFFVDIDFRRDSWRYYQTGKWSFKSYLLNRLVYDPLKRAQLWLAPHYCSLVLLKSAQMVADVGRGASNVRNFFDTAHSADDLLCEAALAERCRRLSDASRPLQVGFFGRFVAYKGLDRAIEAVCRARRESGREIVLQLIGEGAEEPALVERVRRLGAEGAVRFHGPVAYGPRLFARLEELDLVLATPLAEDTPRAAFDAMARGLPLLAFDIAYYRDLEKLSGAVATSPWPDVDALARRLVELDRDRDALVRMARAGVAFAADNTQESWLDRRMAWTRELLES